LGEERLLYPLRQIRELRWDHDAHAPRW
jgi:hypothetical protein